MGFRLRIDFSRLVAGGHELVEILYERGASSRSSMATPFLCGLGHVDGVDGLRRLLVHK